MELPPNQSDKGFFTEGVDSTLGKRKRALLIGPEDPTHPAHEVFMTWYTTPDGAVPPVDDTNRPPDILGRPDHWRPQSGPSIQGWRTQPTWMNPGHWNLEWFLNQRGTGRAWWPVDRQWGYEPEQQPDRGVPFVETGGNYHEHHYEIREDVALTNLLRDVRERGLPAVLAEWLRGLRADRR